MGSFNSRAREGRDGDRAKDRAHKKVSIHAPARGATEAGTKYLPMFLVSIHAPARGATQQNRAVME